MIVFDLKCTGAGHVFEGWFASGEDFERQQMDGLLACPLCGDSAVEKAVMAPAVGMKSNRRNVQPSPVIRDEGQKGEEPHDSKMVPMQSGVDNRKVMQLMHALAQAQAEALSNSEWVGRRFAEEARAIHYGEETHRPIHGEVDSREVRALLEEGVEVAPLLFPVVPPKAQN